MVKLLLETPPDQQIFQQMLFSKIVPNCKKLGLLDAADGWLRERFTELGVIQFEDWVDTGEEYGDLDAVAQAVVGGLVEALDQHAGQGAQLDGVVLAGEDAGDIIARRCEHEQRPCARRD